MLDLMRRAMDLDKLGITTYLYTGVLSMFLSDDHGKCAATS
jgi:hypothetical protein